ncbi:MAG: GNAT family N-acetyltransferase [Clostridium sp.]|nr:GNAT family N-acetyltransferase [Clostridium sp.]MCM1444685.1 GNAT family N-acetyltransferase [Candidatus Amulumruptor caecigallinarius]
MIEFKNISEFPRGTLYNQLKDAYSFNKECIKNWEDSWKEYDDFFYENLDSVGKYIFITVLNGIPIGHISWDPRNKPKYAIIGHNCILTKYKGNGYGKRQLEEAIKRIKADNFNKIIVTTNEITYAAQKNYESVGMKKVNIRENKETPFAGNFIDYELKI